MCHLWAFFNGLLANANPGPDTIILNAGTYGLTLKNPTGCSDLDDTSAIGDLDVTDPLTIIGAGRNATIINGNGIDRVLQNFSTLTLENLTITGGCVHSQISPLMMGGGGIYNSGTLTLRNCCVTGNTAGEGLLAHYGGGICTTGPLALYNTIISDNHAAFEGAGVYSSSTYGTNVIGGCTISNNTATYNAYYYPDGVDASGGTWSIVASTFYGNSAGGFVMSGGTLAITNSTFFSNRVSAGAVNIVSSTIWFSALSYSSLTLKNTIVSATLSDSVTSQGNNLIAYGSNATGVTNGVNGDLVGTSASPIDPKLGPLQDNGGPTLTMALLAGSPAIDAGNNSGAPATDQRGDARIVDGNGDGTATIDIGAYEYDPGPVIGSVVAAEATPQNGKLESNEKLKITWAAASSLGIASQTLAIDGTKIKPINGPYGGLYYSCPIGKYGVGSHSYTITATDSNGVSSSNTGIFNVVTAANTGPTISQVTVSQAKGKISWNAVDSDGVAGSTLQIDGKAVPNVGGPYTAASGVNFSASYGALAAGNHTYTITATDKLGNSSQYTGSFTLVTNPGPTISGVVVSQAKGKISWNAADPDGVASSTLKIDGISVSNVGGPYTAISGVNFSASYGSLASGNHTYTITATDKAGNVSSSSGSFALSASSSAAKNALFSTASPFAPSNSAKVDWLYDLDGLFDSPQSSSEKEGRDSQHACWE
jgi:hypothetical protein